MTDKLKNCPFCGGEAYVTYEDCYGLYHDDYFVCCDKCGLQFGFTNQFDTEEQAIKAWNTRKPMDRIVEEIKDYRELVPSWALAEIIAIVKGVQNE